MRIIVPVVPRVVLVNARRLCHTLVHPTRARRSATLPRVTALIAAAILVVVVVQQMCLVLDHLAVDQLLPLVHSVLPLVHTVIVRSRGRLRT